MVDLVVVLQWALDRRCKEATGQSFSAAEAEEWVSVICKGILEAWLTGDGISAYFLVKGRLIIHGRWSGSTAPPEPLGRGALPQPGLRLGRGCTSKSGALLAQYCYRWHRGQALPMSRIQQRPALQVLRALSNPAAGGTTRFGHAPPSTFEALQQAWSRRASRLGSFPEATFSCGITLFCIIVL